jgi:hypothetical protein
MNQGHPRHCFSGAKSMRSTWPRLPKVAQATDFFTWSGSGQTRDIR